MRSQCTVLCVLLVYIIYMKEVNTNTPKVDLTQENMLFFWRRSNADKCKPFSVFKINCNHCVCAADGTSSCTRMDCANRLTDNMRTTKSKRKKPRDYYEEYEESGQ